MTSNGAAVRQDRRHEVGLDEAHPVGAACADRVLAGQVERLGRDVRRPRS